MKTALDMALDDIFKNWKLFKGDNSQKSYPHIFIVSIAVVFLDIRKSNPTWKWQRPHHKLKKANHFNLP